MEICSYCGELKKINTYKVGDTDLSTRMCTECFIKNKDDEQLREVAGPPPSSPASSPTSPTNTIQPTTPTPPQQTSV